MSAYPALSTRLDQVRLGEPLPFGICDAAGRLLLARGQVIPSQAQLDGLLDRGAFVHHDAAEEAVGRIERARPHELPAHWQENRQALARVLKDQPDPHFEGVLDRAARPVVALVRRDPDLAILQVVRPEDGPVSNYANRHALHAAITSHLAAERLGWGDDAGRSLFRAALTMNLGMSELQNRLAAQVTPLTPLQRQTIQEHPRRGGEILRAGGVSDRLWIDAVECHHEQPDGSGYPRGLTDVGELALLLNRADAFTAKLSPRLTRTPQPADLAVRQTFAADTRSPITAAIVKAFGLYPPGCAVRLRSGEMGIVMRRGETATTPVVAALTTAAGEARPVPLRRDTARPEHAVVAVVPNTTIKVRLPLETMVQACSD